MVRLFNLGSLLLVGALFLGCNDSNHSNAAVPSPPPSPSFAITTTSLPNTNTNNTVNQQLTTANGTAPYTWSILTGSLPSGLTLSSSGQLSGQVALNAGGIYDFTVQAVDGNSDTDTQSLTLKVGSPVRWNGGGLLTGSVGVTYSVDLTTKINGGTAPFTFTVVAGAVPPGFTLTSAGVLSGACNTAGSYSITVRVASSPDPFTGSLSYGDYSTSITIN